MTHRPVMGSLLSSGKGFTPSHDVGATLVVAQGGHKGRPYNGQSSFESILEQPNLQALLRVQ